MACLKIEEMTKDWHKSRKKQILNIKGTPSLSGSPLFISYESNQNYHKKCCRPPPIFVYIAENVKTTKYSQKNKGEST